MAIQIDVVVGVIDRMDERVSFVHCGHAYKGRREEAENGVVLHGGLYGPPYELLVGQNGGHGFSGKVISIIH